MNAKKILFRLRTLFSLHHDSPALGAYFQNKACLVIFAGGHESVCEHDLKQSIS